MAQPKFLCPSLPWRGNDGWSPAFSYGMFHWVYFNTIRNPSTALVAGDTPRQPNGGGAMWLFWEQRNTSGFTTAEADIWFVGTVGEGGCSVFIVHARNAVLKGLSPKENREIPPLKYGYVYRLKQEFPQLEIVINGGIVSQAQIGEHLEHVDGVMLGRAAYHDPWVIADSGKTRAEVVRVMYEYAAGVEHLRQVTRHMLGLYHGAPRARLWRRMLSDAEALRENRRELLLEALDAVENPSRRWLRLRGGRAPGGAGLRRQHPPAARGRDGARLVIPLIALLIGAIVGLILRPEVPGLLQPYLPVAVVAALDAIFGAVRARLEGTFSERVFLISFLTNVVMAVFLVYLGDQLGVGTELSTAVVVVFGFRIFANLAAVRRIIFRA